VGASLRTVRVPLALPAALGEKLRLIVQLALVASTAPQLLVLEKGAAVPMLVIVSGAWPLLVRVTLRLPLSPMATLPKLTLLLLSITAPVMEIRICTDVDRYETEYCVGVAPVKVTEPKVPVIPPDAVSTAYVPLVTVGARAIFRVPASAAAPLTATLELPPELIEASTAPEVVRLPATVALPESVPPAPIATSPITLPFKFRVPPSTVVVPE